MEIVHRDDVSPEQRDEWDLMCQQTTLAMKAHCLRYITPVSRKISETEGELEGSGAYIEFAAKRLVITNEHVLRDWQRRQFAHQFGSCERVFRLAVPLGLEPHPVDAAICEIPDALWQAHLHQAGVVPASRLAARHDPLPGELLFFCGFPQQRSQFLFEHLTSRATPLLTQELPAPPIDDVHPNYFLMPYVPERVQFAEPGGVPLSTPPGLSGSLVWNTRRVECMAQNREWSPALAQVTGMLCRWDSAISAVYAVRIEVLRAFLERHVPSDDAPSSPAERVTQLCALPRSLGPRCSLPSNCWSCIPKPASTKWCFGWV